MPMIEQEPTRTGHFTIRPNDQNPWWPKDPDPAILEALRASRKPSEKDAVLRALALALTRERAAQSRRTGCMLDNLDWLDMVRGLRVAHTSTRPRTDGPGFEHTICWIDGSYPEKPQPITVSPSLRYQEWKEGAGGDRYRYCYVSFGGFNVKAPA